MINNPKHEALQRSKEVSLKRTQMKDRTYKLSRTPKRAKMYKSLDHARKKEGNDYDRFLQGKSHSLSRNRIKEIEAEDRDYYETSRHPDSR